MRYRKLPLEAQLEALPPDEMERARAAAFVACAREPGFQLVTGLLRDLERAAMAALRVGAGNTDRLVGRLQCIEEIRRGLAALLPDPDRAAVDFHDEEDEVFNLPGVADRANEE